MEYRRFGRLDWPVSEVGYGMWGMVGWGTSDIKEIEDSLNLSVELGCRFFDTAWGYAEGESEKLLGRLIKRFPEVKLYYGTKIPPKNFTWPSQPHFPLDACFPADHIVEFTEKSLSNLGVDCIDLMQFHVWEDAWADHDEWKEAITQLKKEGKVQAFGVSVNRWEPENCLNTLKTGLIDAVQVIYNVFDQAPEDELFPLCNALDIATIARVPFDEGTLTGKLTKDTTFADDDWRKSYFVPENLISSVDHAEALRPLVPIGMDMAEMALRFILSNPHVSTTIPGMRRARNVRVNCGASDGARLHDDLLKLLKQHRWDREPTSWSQ